MPDNDPDDSSCKLIIMQLSPPSNIDVKHIKKYIVQYPSGQQDVTSNAVGQMVIVPNCTMDVRLNVSAVNTCGTVGPSVNDIEPNFMARNDSSASTTESSSTSASTVLDNYSVSTVASSTLHAVLLITVFFIL